MVEVRAEVERAAVVTKLLAVQRSQLGCSATGLKKAAVAKGAGLAVDMQSLDMQSSGMQLGSRLK